MKLSTYGIIFLGTPHQGGEGVALGTRVLDVASVFLHTNKNLLLQLEKESERIQDQLLNYRGIQAEFVTIFAYETLPTPRGPLPAAVVVPRSSAVVPGASGTETIAISANHVEMAKFPSPDNKGFKSVSGHLRLMVDKAPEEIQKRWIVRETMDMADFDPAALVAKPKQYFRVPFDLRDVPRSNIFVGRQPEIELIKQNLLSNTDGSERKVCVVCGLGGIGKTQLAIEYARLHKTSYTSVFWLDGKSEESLVQSFLSIANRLPKSQILNFNAQEIRGTEESKERAQDVLQWFALEGNFKWLLIFDNIDRTSFGASDSDAESLASYNITHYFPRGDVGTIIITTRLQRLADLGDAINLRKIDMRNSILILEKHAGKRLKQSSNFIADKEGAEIEEFDPDAVALVKRLEGLPLALVFAGSYIRSTTIAKYLEFYTNSWNDLHETMNIRHDYPRRTIITTWAISYQELKRKDQGAAKLLQFWGCLDNQDLWFQLLRWPRYRAQAPGWLCQITATEVCFMETIRTLLDYSLIEQKEGSHSYSMHAVVHDWIREFVNREGGDDLFRLGVTSVGLAVPTRDERSYWTVQRRLLPHANRLSGYSRKKKLFSMFQEEIDNTSYLQGLGALGNLYSDQGRLAEAETMYERALAGCEKALGPEHTSTLDIVNNLGNLFKSQGRLAEAEAMYERALAGCEKALGPEHTSTLDIVNNLGILYTNQGRLAEAEAMYERALAGCEKALGPEHTSTLDTVNNLGILYSDQGRLAEAEAMYERAGIYKPQR
ncbi:MAG: hypothetical protein M1840_006836 [Geoglossum simile]|nr:MAG: hypothetical protein M1840_006836 [Geoglossum simile]